MEIVGVTRREKQHKAQVAHHLDDVVSSSSGVVVVVAILHKMIVMAVLGLAVVQVGEDAAHLDEVVGTAAVEAEMDDAAAVVVVGVDDDKVAVVVAVADEENSSMERR